MTKEEALKILRYEMQTHIASEVELHIAMGMAIEALSAEPPWIPCSERLPEEIEKRYWVCTNGGYQCVCRWTNDIYGIGANEWGGWGWHIIDKPQYADIAAWMPFPEPYKGGAE